MKTLLISYDLRVPETSEDYKRLIAYIQSFNGYAKPLKSLWLVRTEKTVSTVRDELKSKTDANDGVLVLDVTGANWATFGISEVTTTWMKNNL